MIPRMSKKKLASLGGKLPFSTISSAPKKRIRKKPRSKSEFARIYGSKERVGWVKRQPCAACGGRGSVNAHIGTGGTGYKAHYTKIVPLCGPWDVYIGCHAMYDEHRGRFDALFPDFDAEKACADTESRWLAAHPKGRQE